MKGFKMPRGQALLVVVACSVFASTRGQNQADLADLATGLNVKWTVVTNTKEDYSHQAEITLENTARDLNLTYGPWEIHFSCTYRIESERIGNLGNKEVELPGQDVTVTQLQGDQYYLKPTQNFTSLTPGDKRKIKLKIDYYSVARTDTLPNWYITWPGLKPELIASTKGNRLDFVTARTTVQQWKRLASDEYNPWTVQDRFERNYVADFTYSSEIRVIPKPANVVIAKPDDVLMVTINSSWGVSYSGELNNEARYLGEKLSITPVANSSTVQNVIHLSLGEVNVTAGNVTFKKSADAYILTVNATSQRIEVVGQGAAGVFYGVVTLLGLLDASSQVPECIITDSPRFPYRGLMLDIARNFHPKEDILNIIKVMSSYKLNHLHLHLSDDEGWRIQISNLPELTTFGSQRCYDPAETTCLMPQLGSGPDNATLPGSGFLTTTDYIEILRLANTHHVTVIPEIDMPGHGRAAILSMKLRNSTLTSQGKGDVGNSTVLTEENDPSEYASVQMYSDNAINPCLESTYNFVDIVMTEFISLHSQGQQPLKRFHFGGDEVGSGAWVNSSRCQQLIASHTPPGGSLKWYFYQKVAELAANKSLALGAWGDGLVENKDKPFNLSNSPVKDVLAYAWNNVSRTYQFAEQGYKVVLTHATHLYLDHPDEPDPEERGTYWATRFTDIQKVFFYNAENFYDNVQTQESGAPIPAEELCGAANRSCPHLANPENIIGMEGTLFGETVRTSDNLYHQLFPRLLALADRAWHKASWESLPRGDERDKQQTEDWFSFARAVGYRELPKLEKQNVTYRIPPPGAVLSYGRLLTTPLYPGLVVEYSLDAGINWQNAQPFVLLGDYKYTVWLRTRTADSRRFSRTVIFDPAPQIKITNQPIIDYIAQHLNVQYTVVDNYKKYGTDLFEASIRLSNMGGEVIPGGNWRIYFISVNAIEPAYTLEGREYVDHVANITISHTNGYLFSVGPSARFTGLKPGDHLEFNFRVQFWSVSRYEQMPRWYVSSPGMNARNLNSTREDLAFVSPFNKPETWKRFDFDTFNPWTPAARYDRNSAWEVTPLTSIPVIPTPVSFQTSSKQTVNLLEDHWTVVYDTESLRNIGAAFIDMMKELLPAANISLSQTTPPQRYIRFLVGNVTQGANTSTEAYTVQVQAWSKAVNVTGATPDGVFYGAVTLVQMALKSSPAGSLPESQVEDWPRFSYRGMHVDTARNFIPKDTILKLLKVMALYKLNKLHFHLSDDEGWRLEIKGLEELTKIGGRRCHDLEERECVLSTLGSGADDQSSGSGFYTVADYVEILQLASKLHIQVIPEFDMPGHAHSAIRAMKARQLNLLDIGNHNSGDYVLDDAGDTSQYFSVQYYTDNAVNPCIESTYKFISEVYRQVSEIHKNIQPLKVYHFGGDEVAKGAWVNSSVCASLLRSGVSLKSLFTQRVANITKDVSLAAWEDGLMDHDSIPWNRSLLANKDIIVQAWQNVWEWGVAQRAYNLANAGYKVVFSPVTHMYFDHPQEPTPEERGFYWGTRYTDAFKTFSFMPDDYYMNADIKRSGEPITLAEICGKDNLGCPPLTKPENIFGLQGQLWSETVRSPEQFEYMVFPRLLALAERAWHKGLWEGKETSVRNAPLKSDWARFASSLGSQDLAVLDKLDIAYRVPPPGAKQDGATMSTKVEFPGLQVQYKVQASTWNTLQPTTTFKEGQEITLRTVSADKKRYSTEVKVVMGKIPEPKGQAVTPSVSFIGATFIVIYYCFNMF